jgi:hypothetical protein
MGYTYRSVDDLQKLGERVRGAAVKMTMKQEESHAAAQVEANNDATRSQTGQLTRVPSYEAPTSGRPDDDGNLRSYLEQAYAGVPAMFTAFSVPNPDDCIPMANTFYSAAVTIEPSLEVTHHGDKFSAPLLTPGANGATPIGEMLGFVSLHMKNWDGAAANAFERYLTKLELAAKMQREFATSMGVTLDAQLEIRRRMLTDVWEIGEKTIKVLESLDGWCNSKQSAQTTLTVAGAIAAVVFIFATEGAGIAVAVEGVQSAAAILGAGGQNNVDAEISGATVPPVITSMVNVLTKLRKTIDAQEQELVSCIQQLAATLRINFDRVLVEAPSDFVHVGTASVDTLNNGRQFYDR